MVLVAAIVLSPVCVFADGPPKYVLEWGSNGPGPDQFYHPDAMSGIAVDANGDVYVSDGHYVKKFSNNGQFILSWGGLCSMNDLYGDCADPDGEGPLEVGDGQFRWANGLAIDRAGDVYVADWANNRVQKFDSNGGFLLKWGEPGTGPGQFNGDVADVAVGVDGLVYVVNGPYVHRFTSTGEYVDRWSGGFACPTGIEIDRTGDVFVVEAGGPTDRVQKFTSGGVLLAAWGEMGSATGQFDEPWGLSVDSAGHVYVSDRDNARIQYFDGHGNFIFMWGSDGTGPGDFREPRGIALDSAGNIFIMDSENYRVQKFYYPGPISIRSTSWGNVRDLYR